MSCAKQTFANVTPDQFSALSAKAAASGISMSGNVGQASRSGFTVAWTYDPAAQTLEIQCVSGPFLVPCSTINGRIHDLVDSVVTTTPQTSP